MRSRTMLAATMAALATAAVVPDAASAVDDGGGHRLTIPATTGPLADATDASSTVSRPAGLVRAMRDVVAGRAVRLARASADTVTASAAPASVPTGHAMGAVTIDPTAPRASYLGATPGTVYPVKDGYKDSTPLEGRISERAATTTVQILNSSGKTVRKLSLGGRAAGPVSVTWNGRRADGTMVAAGTYRYRFLAQDIAGNRTTSGKYTVNVSAKKLVKKSGSKTVTAYGSSRQAYIGDCSQVITPGVRGWAKSVGYYSDLENDGSSDCWYYDSNHDLAAADHAVTLPKAVKYGSVRVDVYGGRALDKYNDVAVLLYYTAAGDVSDTGKVLGSAIKTYTGPTVGSRFISRTGRVRWSAGAIDGNFYDIKSFTVHYTYYRPG